MKSAADLVPSGALLALGGSTLYRRPISFVRALIKRYLKTGEPKNLTLFAFTAGLESDLLVGSGMVSRIRTCYFGMEIFGLAPMFTYFAGRGEIEIIEETELSLALGLRASQAQIGFLPGKAWLGTDLPALRPDVVTIRDPYNGEELVAFPAIQPDFAVIHALRADYDGNAVIGGNKGVDEELSVTAKTVIITCEEIVPELEKADLVGPMVHYLIHSPGGAAPTSCHPLYPLDGDALLTYSELVADPKSYQEYIHRWLRIDQDFPHQQSMQHDG